MDKPVLIVGHQHPDTDSVCSAIAYAYLKKQQGWNAEPARAGKLIRKRSLCWIILRFRCPG